MAYRVKIISLIIGELELTLARSCTHGPSEKVFLGNYMTAGQHLDATWCNIWKEMCFIISHLN